MQTLRDCLERKESWEAWGACRAMKHARSPPVFAAKTYMKLVIRTRQPT